MPGSDAQRHAARHLVACHARFALLTPKDRWPNLASQSLSLNLQRLSADWLERYGHPILLVETYVDPQRFEGTCYRAAKWIEIGLAKGLGRSRLNFYQLHPQPARNPGPTPGPAPLARLAPSPRRLPGGHCRHRDDCGQ